MNWDRVEGNWKQMTGGFKQKWAKLTDDDLTMANGNREVLLGRLQERYGIAKDEAGRQLDEYVETYREPVGRY